MSFALALAVPTVSGEQSRSVFEFLHARYLSGDEDPFVVAFPNYDAFRRAKGGILNEMGRRSGGWEPSKSAVVLELGLWVLDRKWPDGTSLIQAARNNVVRRPTLPGANAAEDMFELAFHHTALATLVSTENLVAAKDYFAETDGRIATATSSRGRLSDPRWQFMKAWMVEFQTSPSWTDNTVPESIPSLASSGASRTQMLRVAAEGFAGAMDSRDVAGEATLRFAFTQHRLGDHRAAATALQRITAEDVGADLVLDYWRAIVGGRVHDALGEPELAEREYRQAVARWGGAQTPLIALASLLERRGRSAQAEAWADRVRALPEYASDPWWQYWTGDKRFVKTWRKTIREARP